MSIFGRIFKLSCTVLDKKRTRGLSFPSDVVVRCDIPYLKGNCERGDGDKCGNDNGCKEENDNGCKDGSGDKCKDGHNRGQLKIDRYNMLDVYYPVGTDKKLPTIIIVHGGGYVYGTKEVYQFYGASLAQRGFCVLNINYHLAPKFRFPLQLSEINSALTFAAQNADEYYIDTQNMFLMGDSAGAQIAAHYAVIATNPEFAKLFDFTMPDIVLRGFAANCGIFDLNDTSMIKFNVKSLGLDYIGKNHLSFGEMLNPVKYITDKFPPTFLATSEGDFLKGCAPHMQKMLTDKGVHSEYKLYEPDNKKLGHVFNVDIRLSAANECNTDECNFFKKYIVV